MLQVIVVFFLLSGFVCSNKVCTNTGVQSHTSRYEVFSEEKNSSREEQNLVHLNSILGDNTNSIPRKMLREEEDAGWNILSSETARQIGDNRIGFGAGFLKEVSLHDVRLNPNSIHGLAQQTNLEYLLMLDVDRLVWSFRKTAGLATPGEPYGGWEAPHTELRGHFVGHYMSASAQMWASTHNPGLRKKMSLVVSALSECQRKIGTGYLSAFPSEFFDRFEALHKVWAPYYTIHKILAGLLDQYALAGSGQALNMMKWMVDYFYNRVQNVITKHTIERHWLSLNEETGGMNDVLYRLHTITGDRKHLLLAHLFDKPCFLGLLAMKADDISGFHANTHIPIVVGAQQRYEITGDPLYKEIGTFFMEIVNSSHSYATGGTSVSEFWSDPKRLATTLKTENQESCTTYNMLKVARNLFRWTKKIAYADYYERALTNGVLGIQRGREPGVMIYMLPLHRGGSKAKSYHGWGTKFDSFWCCYGTGIESFSKLGDSIYFEEEGDTPGLYIVQYISSSIDWRSGQIQLTQKVEPVVSWDQRLRVTVTISSKRVFFCSGVQSSSMHICLNMGLVCPNPYVKQQVDGKTSTLNLRIPFWTHSNSSKASLNNQVLALPPPGNFLSITRSWTVGDQISLDLHMSLRTEAIKDDRPEYASVQAFLYGPYLLAGLGNQDFKIRSDSLADWITPIPGDYNSHLITLSQEFNNSAVVLSHFACLIRTQESPKPGSDSAIRATFRLIIKNSDEPQTSPAAKHAPIGKLVMLELFDHPGTFVVHNGNTDTLAISDPSSSGHNRSPVFRVVPGLDGKNSTISLESETLNGCYVYTNLTNGYGSGSNVLLKCNTAVGPIDPGFAEAASFVVQDGISKYDPISFVVEGVTRNSVMTPLYSLRDESYTVYFNTSL